MPEPAALRMSMEYFCSSNHTYQHEFCILRAVWRGFLYAFTVKWHKFSVSSLTHLNEKWGKHTGKQIHNFLTYRQGEINDNRFKTQNERLYFKTKITTEINLQFSSVVQSCPTLCNPMNRSMPGLPVHHQLLMFAQTHVHWVRDAIQPCHPLSSPSPPAPNPSQHQSLFQ